MTKKIAILAFWEQIKINGFIPVEFDGIRMQAGPNGFILHQNAIQQMKLLTADERTPQLQEGKKEK